LSGNCQRGEAGIGEGLQGHTERVEQVLPVFPFQSDDLATSATDVRVDIECLPQVIDRSGARHSSDIDKDANIGLEDWSESVEEPAMRVDLFLVLLLQTE
jgi:hypothetical protein